MEWAPGERVSLSHPPLSVRFPAGAGIIPVAHKCTTQTGGTVRLCPVMPRQASFPQAGGVQHHSHKALSRYAQAGLPLPLDLIHLVMTHFVPFLTCMEAGVYGIHFMRATQF